MRKIYEKSIDEMARTYKEMASSGKITWSQATKEANALRNETMEVLRRRSTPIGRAYAESLKRTGKTLNEMIALKTVKHFGDSAQWNHLSTADKQLVYLKVVESSGKSNDTSNKAARRIAKVGRGVFVLTLAWTVYTVVTAEDHVEAIKKEAASTGAGITGGIAGGAIAGLACGPGAPVCVATGMFVGGALAAFSVDMVW